MVKSKQTAENMVKSKQTAENMVKSKQTAEHKVLKVKNVNKQLTLTLFSL